MHLTDGARAISADFEARFTGSDSPDVIGGERTSKSLFYTVQYNC
jgi:hypothetical protein